jgi:hypothetical protein
LNSCNTLKLPFLLRWRALLCPIFLQGQSTKAKLMLQGTTLWFEATTNSHRAGIFEVNTWNCGLWAYEVWLLLLPDPWHEATMQGQWILRWECSLVRTKPLPWNSIEIMNFSFPRWE